MTTTFANYLIDVLWPDNTSGYFWTGLGDLSFDSRTYLGAGHIVSIDDLEDTLGEPDKRINMSISSIPLDLRNMFIESAGRVQVTIGVITSPDGNTWTRIPRQFVGVVSNPEMRGTVYSFDVVEEALDVDYGRAIFWTDEDQQLKYPGDLGLEHVKDIASGVDLSWPP